ncbi:hypothetical protein PX554_20175 [Sphingomonas sp. H39-1-10]|uniref:hypothetical protein n=1 Tax=Sphingomonas pollutisoli TaxID=3030829 RepID=UPI0023BA32EB|nr:hypothetical protein [Sphingomonas pollutisoli]MDF0490451.1 hypothetical protein [Sphingomonas pollutisoli]
MIDAVRCWREAVDGRQPVVPILFARLESCRAGFLAPAVDALLSLHEAWSGRRFHAGTASASDLTGDERQLLLLLEAGAPSAATSALRPMLTGPMRIALHSTAIILHQVFGWQTSRSNSSAPDRAIFFSSETPAPAYRTADPERETC